MPAFIEEKDNRKCKENGKSSNVKSSELLRFLIIPRTNKVGFRLHEEPLHMCHCTAQLILSFENHVNISYHIMSKGWRSLPHWRRSIIQFSRQGNRKEDLLSVYNGKGFCKRQSQYMMSTSCPQNVPFPPWQVDEEEQLKDGQ